MTNQNRIQLASALEQDGVCIMILSCDRQQLRAGKVSLNIDLSDNCKLSEEGMNTLFGASLGLLGEHIFANCHNHVLDLLKTIVKQNAAAEQVVGEFQRADVPVWILQFSFANTHEISSYVLDGILGYNFSDKEEANRFWALMIGTAASIAGVQVQDTKRESIPREVQREVWRRDQGRCVECGSNERLEFDHIIPVSKNGSNTVRNIQLLCERCNRSKGNRI